MPTHRVAAFVALCGISLVASAQTGFVNWETPHVTPLALTPDGRKLLAVNTPDGRLEIFLIPRPQQAPRVGQLPREPVLLAGGSVPVGLDPVSVRARTNEEAWVVNSISDSISIVNLRTMNVTRTLSTEDEPADVAFAGSPARAFVTCAQASKLMVFDPSDLDAPPLVVALEGEEPRAIAVSPDRSTVYVAVFESGNNTTILGAHGQGSVVQDPSGPYGGQNPPPNDGLDFNPPINANLPIEPPPMGLIVKKNASGEWWDDNTGDWTEFVSGSSANLTGRVVGWDVIDNDVLVIDANTLNVSALTGMMNICMALSVNPADGDVTVVGTDATNEVRFEPNVKARFVRVKLAVGSLAEPNAPALRDLNPHLDYSDAQIAAQADSGTASQALRDASIGDPRGIVWNADGTRGYVSGMGSNNVVVIDATGARIGNPISVGEGPTGVVLNASGSRLYVLNKFSSSISVVDTASSVVTATLAMYDPTPSAIKEGRKFQYDTHLTSGLGQVSCASCHVDARIDRLAWDLGNPAGEMTPFGENCGYEVETVCQDFHPMKGPMLTQTLQDIIGKEPLHWRGDKPGIEDFNAAFTGLQGDDVQLTSVEMQAYEDFLATIALPPNPFRALDNTLAETVILEHQLSSGRFDNDGGLLAGEPMLPGHPAAGMEVFRFRPQHTAGPGPSATCRLCHAFPTGAGADLRFVGQRQNFPNPGSGTFMPIEPGPNGEHHQMTTALTFAQERRTFKVPQLRNLYKRVGFERLSTRSRSGFGFFNDGGEQLENFFARFPNFVDDQELSDMIAFLMAFSGSDLPSTPDSLAEPVGVPSNDTHAAVGKQVTFDAENIDDTAVIAYLDALLGIADAGRVGVVAKGRVGEIAHGYVYDGAGLFRPDRAAEAPITTAALRSLAGTDSELTFTVVPLGTEVRIGVDRDADGIYDGDD